MKLETFFEKFDRLADAPDAVAKMRDLILRLAMQGKLSEGQKTDGPVSELLREVGKEKMRLGLESSAKAPSGNSEFSDEEVSDSIPERWTWVRFGNIARHNAGKTLDKGRNRGKLRDYITTSNLYWGFFQLDAVRQMPILAEELERCTAIKGDLLICEGGEAGRAAVWPNDYEISFQNHVHRARFLSGINPYFIQRYFEKLNATGEIDKYRKGVGISNMSGKALASIPIPLPPLAEQKRIVAKVDELMTLCDRLEAQQHERETRHASLARASLARFADAPTPANLWFLFHPAFAIHPTDFRKSILTLAVQGKLVPQDPNDEPASGLLAQISRKKKAMIAAKHVRQGKVSRPLSALGAPTELPRGWEWVNVDALCFKVTDGTHFTPQYAAAGVRFVSAKDIVSGKLVFDRCKFITQEEHDRLYRRCNPEYHDIVISKSGSIGTVALVEARDEFSLFESLALLKFDQASLFPAFLVCALTHACASLTTGHIRGVGVKHLHLDILRGLEMALPPLAEQRRIVAKVAHLMALVDELETQLAASRAIAANLLSALVAELTDTTSDGKVTVASASGAVRRGRPKEFQPEITQTTP